MSEWDPSLYRRFEDQRTRPARELLARVPMEAPRVVVDLGCGPGNSTELLVARYPGAAVIGTDNSASMLDEARARLPAQRFVDSDIATWTAETPPDLIYSNAALQWVTDHERLLPRLLAQLAPGGVLAIQMPDNREEATHRTMRALAAKPRYAATIGDADAVRSRMLSLDGYYDLLAGQAESVDIWRTAYQHPMDSPAKIVEWLRGTGLRPFTDRLPPAERAAFLAAYEARIDAAYPERADGRRLLAFPRLFIVATRRH